jgi:hypothetical protein
MARTFVASPWRISHNRTIDAMMLRLLRIVLLLLWLELGLVLILAPWSSVWEANFFLYQYPDLGILLKNPFLRGAISGLGLVNVFLSVGAFRRRTAPVVTRT